MKTAKWEDYLITGDNAEVCAEFMQTFLMTMFPELEDRLYMDENYFSIMSHKIEEAKAKFNVDFTLSL